MKDMTHTELADYLFAKGMELTLRGNRLFVWPAKGWKQLTDAERALIKQHREALKALVRANQHPKLPDDFAAENHHPDFALPQPAAHVCVYCGGRPCVGADHFSFRNLHWNDPAEAERRRVAAQRRNTETQTLWRAASITPPRY